MSTAGQKRKLEDTDIPTINTTTTPSLKQQKLTPKTESKEEATPNNTSNTNTSTSINNEQKDEILDNETFCAIKSQLEYYFGNSNLPLDDHILEVSNYSINKGYYPISGLLNFKKIQLLTNSINNLINVIKSSSKLELNSTETGVRRHSSLGPLPTKKDIYSRTIFAKGFHPRCELNDLRNFWETNVSNKTNILSVRAIRDSFSVGIGENNKPQIRKRFLGNCFVEFNTIDLANEFCKMTFKHNGKIIRCGMYNAYYNNEIEWKIKKKILPFKSNIIILVRDIPTYSTWKDIKNWICNGLYNRIKKENSKNKCEYVCKKMNEGCAYVRFSNESDINECVELIKKKPLMGLYPKISVLNDKQAQNIWENVARMKWSVNKDVEIVIKNKSGNKKDNKVKCEEKGNGKEENDDDDVDIVGVKQENSNNNKKHKLDENESTQPVKKQKTC